jgi:TPP-dependent 2-oxoacid decarboxylase
MSFETNLQPQSFCSLLAVQLFAGNIGWATPAGLGFLLAQWREGRRLVVC